MNIIKEIENIGTVRYEESFWTGKKSLFLNGVPLTKLSKTEFEYAKDEVVMKFSLNGSVLSGVNVVVNGARYELIQKTAWYEYIAAFIGFLFILIWGNVPSLCKIFPVVGGAIGGLFGALGGILGILMMRVSNKPILRILLGLAGSLIAVLVCFLIGFAIVSATK